MRGVLNAGPMETLPELEDRLAQVESLVVAAPDEATFSRELLRMLLSACGGVGAQVWSAEDQEPPRISHQSFLTPEAARAAEAHPDALQAAIASAVSRGDTGVLLPASHAANASGKSEDNPTLFYWILSPIHRGGETYAVLAVWIESDWDPQVVQRVAELVDSHSQLAVGWFEQRRLKRLKEDNSFWTRTNAFLERLHAETSLDEVGYTAANGIRTLLECDRVWVLLRTGRTSRVLAVSGVQQPDHRSNQIRSLRKLGGALAAASLPLNWSRGAPVHQALSLKSLVNAYLDESHLAELTAVPLVRPAVDGSPAACLGMLFVERFAPPEQPVARDVNPLASQVAVALQNARDWQLAPVAARLRSWRRTARSPWRKWVIGLSAGAAVIAALVLIPADFTVEARGELQPQRQQHVFAAEDGTIEALHVKTGQTVRTGQPVIDLRNLALEQELQRVSGEMETTQRRIASLEAQRLDFESNPDRPASQRLQVTAELEELRVTQDSLVRQLKLLEQRRRLLHLVSPIEGQVQTWDVEQLLNGRPVRRGQQLLTVADTSGPWIVEVQVPDARTGDVLDARKSQEGPLSVEFAVATSPGRLHVGRLTRLAMSTETHDQATGAALLAEVAFDRSTVPDLRGGARVTAKIHCGRRPLGYVWFIDAWRAIQRWILF